MQNSPSLTTQNARLNRLLTRAESDLQLIGAQLEEAVTLVGNLSKVDMQKQAATVTASQLQKLYETLSTIQASCSWYSDTNE